MIVRSTDNPLRCDLRHLGYSWFEICHRNLSPAHDGSFMVASGRERHMPTKEEFTAELQAQLREAQLRLQPSVDINSGDIHRKLGGYPAKAGAPHQMSSCCDAMRDERRVNDALVPGGPKTGKGVITIRYALPR